MKPSTLLFVGSLVANAGAIGYFFLKPERAPAVVQGYLSSWSRSGPGHGGNSSTGGAAAAGTENGSSKKSMVRHDVSAGQLWSELYSSDLKEFAARLTAAGFPPGKVRGLVAAEIDRRLNGQIEAYLQKAIPANAPFWRQNPSGINNREIVQASNSIRSQRAALLREALGGNPDARPDGTPTPAQIRQYGNISAAKIEAVQSITSDYSDMTTQLRALTIGSVVLPEDEQKLAMLEQEKRADLAAILTPDELAEYDLHTSTTTARLRQPLSMMQATETEFRTIYGILDPLSSVLNPGSGLGGMMGPDTMQQRRDAQQQVAEQLKAALGPERYADYARVSNPEYRQLYQTAQKENIPVAATVQAFNLRDTSSEESMRIYADTSLSTEQKHEALQQLGQQVRAQAQTLLGPAVGTTYLNSASWLRAIESDGAVTFGPDGTGTTIRRLPRSQPRSP